MFISDVAKKIVFNGLAALAVATSCLTVQADLPDKTLDPALVIDAAGHTSMIRTVMFTRDGRELITVARDKTIRFWDVSNGEPLRTWRPAMRPGMEGMLYVGAMSGDGRYIAVGGYGWLGGPFPIHVISLETGEVKQTLLGHSNVIQALALNYDGSRLVSGSNDLKGIIWNVNTGEALHTLEGHTQPIYCAAFSPDGSTLALGAYDNLATVWSASTGKLQYVLKGHTAQVHSMAWSPDGTRIATGGLDHTIRLWSTSGQLLKTLDNIGERQILGVNFSSDSKRLIFATYDTNWTQIAGTIDIASGRRLVDYTGHGGTVYCATFSPDNKLAASCDADGVAVLWDPSTGKEIRRFKGLGSGIWNTGWHPDGNSIAFGITPDGNTRKASNSLEKTFDFSRLEWGPAPDASYTTAMMQRGASNIELAEDSSTAAVIKRGGRVTSRLEFTTEYDKQFNIMLCFSMLPGERAAVGSSFGLDLFDVKTGAWIKNLSGHTAAVWSVSPSPDQRYLMTSSGDETIIIWDLQQDRILLSFFAAGQEWIAWTPEGYYACSPGGERLIGWHLDNGPYRLATFAPAAQFREKFFRPEAIKMLLRTGNIDRALAATTGEAAQSIVENQPPTVIIASPDLLNLTVHEAMLDVRGISQKVGMHGIKSMRLLLNGGPYNGNLSMREYVSPQGEARETWQVELVPGKHLIQIEADNGVSRGISKTLEVTYEPKGNTNQLPALYILAVGVSDYLDDELDLNYAHRDAQEFVKTMKDYGKGLYRDIIVKELVNADATQRGIRGGLSWFRKQMTQHDVGIVFYSGHGDRDVDGTFYFLPSDVERGDLFTSGVPESTIKTLLKGVPGKKIMMLDCCHAGSVGQSEKDPTKGDKAVTDDLVRDLVTTEFGVIMMCSSTGRELSAESHKHQNGYFTVALKEGLSGMKPGETRLSHPDSNNDGAIYWNELDVYVSNRVKELTNGNQHPVTAHPTIRPYPLTRLK